MSIFEELNHVHLIGIGGIGMSALARFFLSEGKTVTGSDANDSALIRALQQEGAEVQIGHGHVPEAAEAVIYSEAIAEDNPERMAIGERPAFNYFQALGEISRPYKVLAVAGTHGKTTTTAMLGYLLQESGYDPTVIVGSTVPQFDGKNFRKGKSEWMVVEACEYRRNFLPLKPYVLGITNIELDHLDYFKDEADYQAAFEQLKRQSEIVVSPEAFGAELRLPGVHNQENAGLAAAMARAIGLTDFRPLKDFKGTWRRYEQKEPWNGAHVIDDYAHHPTEIAVTLKTARAQHPRKRLIAVFQPHQHSRTAAFLDEFAEALNEADLIFIPNIYGTRDSKEDEARMSAERFVEHLKSKGLSVIHPGSLETTKEILNQTLSPEDCLVVMGAGDVSKVLT